MHRAVTIALSLGLGILPVPPPLLAQSPPAASTGHQMHRHDASSMAEGGPTQPGQDAFGAIAEVVRLLEADPGTTGPGSISSGCGSISST